MIFIHGSPSEINGGFKLFDYIYDTNTQKSNIPEINSGLDAEGIGIYAFIGDSQESIDSTAPYVNGDGYIYHLTIESDYIEKPLNERGVDEISIEEWESVIRSFIKDVRFMEGYDEDTFLDVLNNLEEEWDDENKLTLDDLNKLFKTAGLKIELTEYQDQNEFDNFDDWRMAMEELYYSEEPFWQINESGGIENVLDYAINKSDNLWDVIKNIGEQFAVMNNGGIVKSYNRTFHRNVMNQLEHYNLNYAVSNNGKFAIIFDVDSISIQKVLKVKKEQNQDKKAQNKPS